MQIQKIIQGECTFITKFPLSGEIRTRIKMLVIKKLIHVHFKFYENIFP